MDLLYLLKDRTITSLFSKPPASGLKVIILMLFSVSLIIFDRYSIFLQPLRSYISSGLMPLYWMASIPESLIDNTSKKVYEFMHISQENKRLTRENILYKRYIRKIDSLNKKDQDMHELFRIADSIKRKVELVESISINPDSGIQRIMINRGEEDGVLLGQPVINSRGLVGQITELRPKTSYVLLLTDQSHSIPVQVNRSGFRGIADGIGKKYFLEIRDIPSTVDIKEGDHLVSSGLGKRFPTGYPVGIVDKVLHESGKPFSTVVIIPTAIPMRNHYLLLILE